MRLDPSFLIESQKQFSDTLCEIEVKQTKHMNFLYHLSLESECFAREQIQVK